MIKQAPLALAARLARSVALSGTAAVALGGFAGQPHASLRWFPRLQINALGGRDKATVDDDVSNVVQVSVDLGDQRRSNREPNDAGMRTDTHQTTS
jgi:hypothetical protein